MKKTTIVASRDVNPATFEAADQLRQLRAEYETQAKKLHQEYEEARERLSSSCKKEHEALWQLIYDDAGLDPSKEWRVIDEALEEGVLIFVEDEDGDGDAANLSGPSLGAKLAAMLGGRLEHADENGGMIVVDRDSLRDD